MFIHSLIIIFYLFIFYYIYFVFIYLFTYLFIYLSIYHLGLKRVPQVKHTQTPQFAKRKRF